MENLNRRLSVVAAIMLALSVGTYWTGVTRADRFESGQKLLPNLNPDEIGDIALSSDEETVTLERQASAETKDEYTVAEKGDYVARNESVNRIVRDLLELELSKEVGTGESLAESLGIEPPGDDAVDVAIENRSGQEMLRLRFGDLAEDGDGRYVRRLDLEEAPIYLTTTSPSFDTDPGAYLRKEIVHVEGSEIARVEGPDFVLERPEDGDDLMLAELRSGETVDSGALNRVKSAFSRLQFQDVLVADDPVVADLEWRRGLRVTLDDQSGYAAMVAEGAEGDGDPKSYLRISSFLGVERIEVTREETDEELKEKSQILKRNDEVQQFNAYHGSWVYELTDTVGEKLALRRADLMSDD